MPSWRLRFFDGVGNCCWSFDFHFSACSVGLSLTFFAQFSVPRKSNGKTVVLSDVFYVAVCRAIYEAE
jgi:hypothetical protein